MNKEEFAKKAGIDPKGLEGFSEETLNEMDMEGVDGGEDVNIFSCGSTNNCKGGYC